MNTAYFRWQNNENVVDITFLYVCEQSAIKKVFNFKRPIIELVDVTLKRMNTNVEKEISKRSKTKKAKPNKKASAESKPETDTDSKPAADDTDDGKVFLVNAIGESILGIDWTELFINNPDTYRNAVLRVRNADYFLAFNYPYVGRLDLPTCIMVGFDCFPTKLEVQFTSTDECAFKWYKGLPRPNNEGAIKDINWTQCGNSFIYNVRAEDVGHKIKLECIPKRDNLIGPPMEAVSKCIVDAGPGYNAFETKQMFTPTKLPTTGNQFRVVSYNLLADYYSDSDFSRTELFPYCPPYALAIDYRKQLFLREIRGYHADLICMQEVDEKIFDIDLTILLGQDGLKGCYKKKGDASEGLATFYDETKFSLVRSYGFNLADELDSLPCFTKLFKKVKKNKKLTERMLALGTALQVTFLKSREHDKYLLVANTHLYFHPDADHIRLLQIGFFMSYVRHMRETFVNEEKIPNKDLSIIFCGDFNSIPECGIYKLMTEQFVPDNFIDFYSNREQLITDVCLNQPYNIASAYNTPPFTNYTAGFKACLDYIFYETDELKVVQAVPLPSEEELSALTAIPSIHFPSDHIALVADLEWISSKE